MATHFYLDPTCANNGKGIGQTCGAWNGDGPWSYPVGIAWTTALTNNLSGWTNDAVNPYDTLTSSGANITSAIQSGDPKTTKVNSNTLNTTIGKVYQLSLTLTLSSGQLPVISGTGGFPTTELSAGVNIITWAATGTSTQLTITNTSSSNFSTGSTTWYTGTVKAEIDYGNEVIIHIKGGTTVTQGQLNVLYGGSSDSCRVIIDGDYTVWGDTKNAEIDVWQAVTGEWSIPDANGVYNIAYNPLAGQSPSQMFEDAKNTAALMKKQSTTTWVDEPGTWSWAANILYYKPSSGVPTDHTVYGWKAQSCISTGSKNYVTIKNIKAVGGNYIGIDLTGGTGCKVENCEATESYMGIGMRNSSLNATIGGSATKGNIVHDTWGPGAIYNLSGSHDAIISYNTVYDTNNNNHNLNDKIGIAVDGENPGQRVIVEYNEIYNNGPTNISVPGGPSISFYQAVDAIARYNFIHDNYSGGISITSTSTRAKAHDNIIINNGRGIGLSNLGDIFVSVTDTVEIYNNTCYGNQNNIIGGNLNTSLGINNATNCVLKNNIISSPLNNYLVAISGTNTGTVVNNNIYHKLGDQFYYSAAAHSFDDYKSAFGYDANSYQIDPQFINGSGLFNLDTDFKLLSSSIGILSGAYILGSTQDYFGNLRIPPFSIGAYEFAGGSGTLSVDLSLGGGGRMIPPRRRRR